MRKTTFISASVLALFSLVLLTEPAAALSIYDGVNSAKGSNVPTELFGPGSIITTIVNILLFIVGALSVIMLIIGGLRYAISGGNASTVTAAKNTILYAIVGLVIALLSYAAIQFVMNTLAGGGSGFGGYTDV
jgi:hypothetical protein